MADTNSKYSGTALVLLKANLGYYNTDIPEELEKYLLYLLEYAHDRLAETAKIYLTPGKLYDDQLQVMYAAWMYRNGTAGAAKTPALKEAIRDYQVGKALSNGEAGA